MASGPRPVGRMLAYGAITGVLYLLLFLYAEPIMRLYLRPDGLYWLLPVVIAFAFSLAHGAFTGYFWDVLGVQGKSGAEKAKG